MKETQFRVLYRQFLFRMVDIELLSADAKGDMGKLFGQFAALLIFFSIGLSVIGASVSKTGLGPAGQMVAEWSGVHFVISTTMLVVGLFAVLSWDSTFPDQRDVMALAPLPIRPRTIFLAKIAAVATALSVTVLTLHILAGVVWPSSLDNKRAAVTAPSIAYDPAMPALDVSHLESVLSQDLKPVLRAGPLSPGTGGGATIGVWKDGQQKVMAYGAARPDSIFEIGSITKTFTALALAQAVTQGKASLDEPVRELLPAGTATQPEGKEITLLDLATHRSGLPPVPDNLHPENPLNPVAGYQTADLYAYISKRGVALPRYLSFSYSNLGFGLLGQALANRAGTDYSSLLRGITEPLGMRDTVVNLSPEQTARVIQGYAGSGNPVGLMDLGPLAGAGAIRSTAGDMLRYLAANLHSETTPEASGLREAIEFQHKLRGRVAPGASIALSWLHDDDNGTYSHNGATIGYSSQAFFSTKGQYAVIVLTNVGVPDLFLFASALGEHVRARLTGERALSLRTTIVPAATGGLADFLRLFAAWWTTMLLAGAFIYCCVLGIQGLFALFLPRRYFLRVSSLMQLAAFGIFVIAWFAEPKIVTPVDLAASRTSVYLEWSPSYWFLGLFQQLNGSPALADLARRGWIAIAIALSATASAYTLAYFRMMRRIVEEPNIVPAARGWNLLPRFGNNFATAIGQFSIRTLLRSRQHRLLLAFYLGIGFACTILYRRGDNALGASDDPIKIGILCATITIMLLSVVGMRMVFSLPTDMGANWIFRITPIPSGPRCMAARRRILYALSVIPLCLGTAVLLFTSLPQSAAAKHLLLITLLGIAIAELCLHGRQKLPFTCSYLPGKSNFNMSFLLCSLLFVDIIVGAAELERYSFENPAGYTAAVVLMLFLAIIARWSAMRLAKSPEGTLQFEESAEPALFTLDLHRDGVTALEPPPGSV